jgi:hypothetical protein
MALRREIVCRSAALPRTLWKASGFPASRFYLRGYASVLGKAQPSPRKIPECLGKPEAFRKVWQSHY